jgi:DNA-binding NarL/FixJ family response regulator
MSQGVGDIGCPRPGTAGPILIVDGDDESRSSLARLLGRAGYETQELASGEEALEAAACSGAGLVVLDVSLPDMSGYTVCRQLRDRFGSELPIIFVSGERTASHDRMAGLLIGADEYLSKPYPSDEFLFRVQRLVRRAAPATTPLPFALTTREHEILQLLAQGLSQKEMAQQLYLSPKTVNTYVDRLYEKLDVHSKTQAVALAFRRGLLAYSSASKSSASELMQ